MENIIYDENTKRKRKCKIFFISVLLSSCGGKGSQGRFINFGL
jgi:hypothetical protein